MPIYVRWISLSTIIISLILFILLPLTIISKFSSHVSAHFNNPYPLPLPKIHPLHIKVGMCSIHQFDDSMWKYKKLSRETECMAENIYFEARGQSIRGQLAVGLVIINRVISTKYPNSICGVVWQHKNYDSGRVIAQFSWTTDGYTNIPNKKSKAWITSKLVAESLLAGGSLFNIVDFTHDSTNYHADYVTPYWSKILHKTITVGDHLFYNNNTTVANISASAL